MTRPHILLVALAVAGLPDASEAAPPAPPPPTPVPAPAPSSERLEALDPEACVALALDRSGRVAEAGAKVAEWQARLAEVRATWYPKLSGTAYLAPMYRLHSGPDAATVDRDYGEWGPYLHLDALLVQPVYTFGRVAAGRRAAEDRLAVEQAAAERTANEVALEVRRLFHLHQYARSIGRILEGARSSLDEALRTAEKAWNEGTGQVTNVDVQKLRYGSAELDRRRIEAREGAALALAALKHTMGLRQETELTLDETGLAPAGDAPLPPLSHYLQTAAEHRPEWTQIRKGRAAALSLADAERLANAPTVFLAAQLGADYTAMRPDATDPYDYDPYNGVEGGLALGLRFDLDPARAAARSEQALALADQVDALGQFAATGIPLEVRKAHDEVRVARETLEVSQAGAVAARKWMVFAGAAFSTGTGPAKDLLEGLVAWLTASNDRLEALRDLHVARATLLYSVGLSRPDAGVAPWAASAEDAEEP